MLLVISLMRWWYADGLRRQISLLSNKLDGTLDFFSFSILVNTLFVPFRQISTGKVDGSLEVQFRAFIDNTFSRLIGAAIRTIIIFTGSIVLVLQLLISLITILIWLLLPFLPVACVVFAIAGVKL